MEPTASATPETNPTPPGEQSPIAQQFGQPSSNPAPGNENKLPSAFSLFKPSWEALKLNLKTFVLLGFVPYLIFAVLAIILGIGSAIWGNNHTFANIAVVPIVIFGLVFLAFSLVLGPALIYTQIQSARGDKVEPKAALAVGKRLWIRFLGISFLSGLIIFLGILALVVPGIIFLRRYFLSSYYLVDKDLRIMEAMNQSAAESKGRSGAIWGVVGVLILISLLGIIPVVGQIASAVLGIIYYCAAAVRYTQLATVSSK